jgi:hypothetical protein
MSLLNLASTKMLLPPPFLLTPLPAAAAAAAAAALMGCCLNKRPGPTPLQYFSYFYWRRRRRQQSTLAEFSSENVGCAKQGQNSFFFFLFFFLSRETFLDRDFGKAFLTVADYLCPICLWHERERESGLIFYSSLTPLSSLRSEWHHETITTDFIEKSFWPSEQGWQARPQIVLWKNILVLKLKFKVESKKHGLAKIVSRPSS